MAAEVVTDHNGATLYADVLNAPGTVYLGHGDEAKAKAREIIAALGAWLRPWVTDGSLPDNIDYVEILSTCGSVVRGYFSVTLSGWYVLTNSGGLLLLAVNDVRGWRKLTPIEFDADGCIIPQAGA